MARQDPGEPYFRVDSDEAVQILEREGDGAVVVDVRRDDEWVAGHASNAIHIPIDDLLGRIDELPQGKKLLFICAAGVRSGLACEMAASTGFPSENLYNVEDGTPTWIERNHPTSYGDDP
jgi:rhodanese-related sulfurtransferase